ncbi:uncharacterized protein LOC115629862 [Scaptodrosophila lebanonensis]|uniref:Uncharacterized protein LOC115629862 n=1 Tax=Drosophila lebanonensis TaxID=7225 RepID=A0A6J2U353_DROLE|nr:uncharacterized protein LOC115629862 [Scaptodrosophila lebanonensis]
MSPTQQAQQRTVAPTLDNNDGHDGLKRTKKKQLRQQHFEPLALVAPTVAITASTTSSSTESSTRVATTIIETEIERIPTTPNPAEKVSTTTTGNINKPYILSSLLPVHNGYLGPILMGEKTFSRVVHPLKKPHAPLIETQLRKGRIIEIIAPKEVVEKRSNVTPTAMPTQPPAMKSIMERVQPSTATDSNSTNAAMLSTTVFQVFGLPSSTTHLPTTSKGKQLNGPRIESKISDIQIEVYDSTVDSIVASTNFRDTEGSYALPQESAVGTNRPPTSAIQQERFTQYVIDRADVSTQQSSGVQNAGGPAFGRPEPAAIEIHINVSEAFGNESEDLEFSYRQLPETLNEREHSVSLPTRSGGMSRERSDEILVVEIIDTGDNITESSVSAEHININPILTFHSDPAADAKHVPPPALQSILRSPQDADELFMADLKSGVEDGLLRPPPPPPPPPPRKASIDRDSDTIFYISNTEVKVGESLPTTSPFEAAAAAGSEQQQVRKFQFENQFFPINYADQQRTSLTPPPASAIHQQRFEEDIILSPLHNTGDSLKIFRTTSTGGDGSPPLDVTYVGESVIEVEQSQSGTGSPGAGLTTALSPTLVPTHPLPDIVIQPAVLPDLAIGVPVIGELPPQIELKEIDYMPGELGVQGSIGIYENDIEGNSIVGSDPDVMDGNRESESSIQYGGDLIDDGAGGGFDGVEGSYPFENPAHRMDQPLDRRLSHLRREELPGVEILNATLLQHFGNGTSSVSGTAIAPLTFNVSQLPESISNATALSEDPLVDFDGYLNIFAVSIGLVIVILPTALLVSMYCAIRYLLNRKASQSVDGDYERHGNENGNGNHNGNVSFNANESEHGGEAGGERRCLNAAEDISRNARETKMHTDKDGVFIVEVARGIDAKQLPDSPGVETTELPFDTKQANGVHAVDLQTLPPSCEQVQIHAPPIGIDYGNGANIEELQQQHQRGGLQLIEELQEEETCLAPVHQIVQNDLQDGQRDEDESNELPLNLNTGLSQSDLSSTSSSDSNKRYSYGNQELYIIEQQGYATSSPTAHPLLISSRVAAEPDDNDRKSENGNNLEHVAKPLDEDDKPNQATIQNVKPNVADITEARLQETPLLVPKVIGNHNAETDNKDAHNSTNQLTEQEQQPSEFHNLTEEKPEKLAEPTLKQEQEQKQEIAYDSLMSLPAPPSTEEIKELNDFTFIESNQMDSLPPPPPPPPLQADVDANGNGHGQPESEQEQEQELKAGHEQQISIGLTNANGNGNIANSKLPVSCFVAPTHPPQQQPRVLMEAIGTGKELPVTLTPPASAPASPENNSALPPPSPPSLYGAALTNGIHAPLPAVALAMGVNVSGS